MISAAPSAAWLRPQGAASLTDFLRNGSGRRVRRDGAPQILKFEQHAEDALELAVEVHFVAGQLFEPVGLQRLAEGPRLDQVAVP